MTPDLLEDFARESLYHPSHWFVHEILRFDRDAHEVVVGLDTTRIGPLVDAQQPWPGHPKHVPGAVVIQMTGTIGNLHAVYAMGLRASEGWVGYGTHVRDARFRRLATIGPPVVARAVAHKRRQLRGTWFLDYRFEFAQEGEAVYESEQTAVWHRREGDER